MKFRFYLVINEVRTEVFPLEAGKLKKVTAKEKDHIFYRTKLSGNVVLDKTGGFQHLHQLEKSVDRCTEVKFVIEKYCSGFWQTDWEGYFSCNDVKWDEAKCTATFTPAPDDKYRPLLDNYGKQVNILEGTTPVTTTANLNFEGEFDFLITTFDGLPEEHADTYAPFIELNYWVDGQLTTKGYRYNGKVWYRLIRFAPYENGEPQELEGWTLVDEDADTQVAKYGKMPDMYDFEPYNWNYKNNFGLYPELVQVDCGTTFDEAKYIDVTSYLTGDKMSGECLNLKEKVFESREIKILWQFGGFTYSRNRTFLDVLKRIAEQSIGSTFLPTDIATVSRFFSEPVNYVTGRPNTLTGLQIASLSDVIGYNSSEAATKCETSLKSLLDNFRKMFRVFWDVTEEGYLRLEHESFYQLQGEVDLTIHEKQLRGTEAYEYDKQDMPRYQKLTFQNANNDDFITGTIEYGGVCVNQEEGQNEEEEQITDITTDLEYIIVSGGGAGQKGLVLMLVQNGMVLEETGDLSGLSFPNAGLSAANLVRDYYTHNRVLENGLVNNKIRIFKSVNKTKKQVPLKNLPGCCEAVNPYAKFISTLGSNATLDTLNQQLSTGSMEIVLLHDTTGTGQVSQGRQFDDSFDYSLG